MLCLLCLLCPTAGVGLPAIVFDALASPAIAAAPGVPDPADRQYEQPVIGGDRDHLGQLLRSAVDSYLAASGAIHQRMLPWGLNLLVLLTGLSLVWIGLKAALEQAAIGQLMSEFLTLTLSAGILFSLLDNWPAVTVSVVDGAAAVARQVSGNVHEGGAAVHGAQRIIDAGLVLWEHPQSSIGTVLDPGSYLGTLLLKLGILLLLAVCAGIYLFMYLVSMTLLSIAFALGPVFLPWLLIRPASFLFDGWLRFTLVAALYQVVGILIVTLVSTLHEPLLAGVSAAVAQGGGSFNFFHFVVALLIGGVSALMMLMIPTIANALVSGSLMARHIGGQARHGDGRSRGGGGGGSGTARADRPSASAGSGPGDPSSERPVVTRSVVPTSVPPSLSSSAAPTIDRSSR